MRAPAGRGISQQPRLPALGSQQPRLRALGLTLLLSLAACQTASEPGTSPATPASPTAYPDLATVPQRPELGYTVAQRQAIADQLVADRAHAQYSAARLAYATGHSATPPPGPPPAAAAADTPASAPLPAEAPKAAAKEAPGSGRIARGYVEANLNAAADSGQLRKFMRRMDRPIPDPYGPRSVAQLVGLAPPPAGPPAPDPGNQSFGSFLGGALGIETEDDVSPASQR